jgi:uncharacterized UPF0146 family protein
MEIKYIKTNNDHLKLLNEPIKNIIDRIINKKDKIKILNIGGGYEKDIEKYLYSDKRVEYYCLDIDIDRISNHQNIIKGDITDINLDLNNTFDFIYTSNTFEHILNPWDATNNIIKLLSEEGYFMCIVPFSWRYHACPVDVYRYTHTGIRYLFERNNKIEYIFSGYKKHGNVKSWYKSKTDVTIDGDVFKENIEVVYIARKNSNTIFNIENLDIDKKKH